MQARSGRIALVIALLTATIHAQAPADLAGLTFNAHVIGIVDGDTLDVLKANTKRTVRIRLDSIDAPERGEPFTQQARNLTRVLAFDQDVIVIGKELDRYGRLVARVRLDATGQHALGPQLWASVFLHDLARTHDGVCHQHGADAVQRLRGEPDLQQRLAEAGLIEADYPAIEAAVTAHSAPKEVSRTHPHWPLIALLKDADGLDRVRLGDLDPRRLRHPEAKAMVSFAQELFDTTDGVVATGPAHFEQIWEAACRLPVLVKSSIPPV